MCAVRFFFQAEDGIRDLVRSRGLGDVYKRQALGVLEALAGAGAAVLLALLLAGVAREEALALEGLSLIHI